MTRPGGCGLQSGRIPDEQQRQRDAVGTGYRAEGIHAQVLLFQARRDGPVIASHFQDGRNQHPGAHHHHHYYHHLRFPDTMAQTVLDAR